MTSDSAFGPFDLLQATIQDLDDASVRQLLQIARALSTPIRATVSPQDGLFADDFRQEFEARLKVHHATHSKQLDRTSLEDAFRAASRAAGRSVRGSSYATEPFIDEVVDGEGVALKSTAAKDVRASRAHISKLCEASWIQDVRGAAAREAAAKDQMARFLENVARIYQLRVLPSPTHWNYQFIEIPTLLFEPILELDRQLFAPDGPRIPVTDALGQCLTLVLDRSDAKITISNIPIERCVVHGTWELRKKDGDSGFSAND